MKKLFSGLLALVVLLLAAALIGPSFVDWNEYKPEIVARIKAMTGRDLVIDGDIDLAVLPAPTLSVNGLRIANVEGAAAPDMIDLKALRVRVALRPLFEGTVKVEHIALVEPVIELEVLPDGRPNWEVAVSEMRSEAPPATPPVGAEAEAEAPGRAVKVRLDRFRIENGTLTFRDSAAGTLERIEKLDAEITADTLAGPFKARGNMTVRGLPVVFELATGRIAEGRPLSFNSSFQLGAAGGLIGFAGSLSEPSAAGEVSGKLRAEGDSLGRLIEAVAGAAAGAEPGPELPGVLAQRFSLEGSVTGSSAALNLDDITLQLGETRATGAVSVALGTPLAVDIALTANRVDLDRWLAMEETRDQGRKGGPGWAAPSVGGGPDLPAAEADEKDFALPDAVKGSLDLAVEAVVYKGGVIREAKLGAVLDQGRLNLTQASALLPGSSRVAASGVLAPAQGKPSFDGEVEVVSDNLRGVFDWLELDASAVPADRLRKVSFKSAVSATPAQVDLTGIDLSLDATRLTGGLAIALRARPAFGVRLDVDRFNLDAYLPPPRRQEAPPATPTAGKPARLSPAKPEPVLPALAVLNVFDANVQASIASLTVGGMHIKGLTLDGTIQGGELTLRKAGVGDLAGAALQLSGTATGFGKTPVVDADFTFEAKGLGPLLRLAEVEPPAAVERMGPLAFSGKGRGAIDNLDLDAAIEAAGGRVGLKGTVGLGADPVRFDLALDATHPDLIKLVGVFAKDYRPAAPTLGGFALATKLRGDATAASLSGLEAKVGPVTLVGEMKARLDGPRPQLTATFSASEIVVDDFLAPKADRPAAAGAGKGAGAGGAAKATAAPAGGRWSKEPLELSGLTAVDADIRLAAPAISYDKYRVTGPKVVLALKDGTLEVRELTGTMFEGAFDLKGRLDAAGVPALQGVVSVTDANIREALFAAGNIDIAQGRLDFNMTVDARGRSPFALVSALGGKGAVKVADGVVRGFDLAAVSERLKNLSSAESYLAFMGSAMSGGETRFSRLDGTFTIDKGVVRTDDLRLVAQGGEGKGAGRIDLPRWVLDMRAEFRLTEHPKAPPFGMRVSGPIDAPSRKFETERMQAFLLQRGVGTLLKKVLPKEMRPKAAPAPGAAPGTATTAPAPERPLDALLKKVLPKELIPAQPAPAPAPAQPAPAPAQPAPAPAPAPEAQWTDPGAAPQPAPQAQPAPAEPAPAQPPPERRKPKPEDLIKDLLKELRL